MQIDRRKFERNSSNLEPYIKAHEIVPLHFVDAEAGIACKQEGERVREVAPAQRAAYPDASRVIADNPARRSCRERAKPDRFVYYSQVRTLTEDEHRHCVMHCCISELDTV